MGWSKKYKKSINCNNPKGFSQKAHCAGRKKQENEMSLKLEELVGKKLTEEQFDEAAGKKDACYHKVKARYDVWPSAYASGALVKCRKVGAKNWGNKSKKEGVNERDNVAMAYKRTLSNKVELKKLKDAIEMFQKKIKKQGMATNARDEDHLANLIKVYKDMGGKGVRESVNEGPTETRELKLYIDNDSQLYNQRYMPIIKNLSKKMKKGKFDKRLAVKGFMYLVDDGARKYIRDYGGSKGMFSKKDKIEVAKQFADEFEEIYKNKEYDFMEGLADKLGKSISKYNKKRKKNMDAMKKLKKKESVEEAYDIWAEDGSFGYTMTGIVEAEYGGRKVKLGKPMQGDVKKFKVYVKNPKGNVVKVNFGQGGGAKGGTMRIRKSNPKARANFRARHNCDNPGPRHKARYWSCKKW